ncbi:PadR family transcriptional regulator [Kineococcus sp. LSe6-4]|uniref:PadR family transcriptional regulator n=1 Tax=Kineococcus halophytocola TaxID=3234027 RepID=A0ABV4H5W1_9ACTN
MTTTDDPTQPWPAQWLRGVLDLAVLAVIARGQTYGYRIGADLHDLGLGTVKGGTLYPLLARLEETGAVQTTWRAGESGPGRKWYTLTGPGRERLHREGARWRVFAGVTSDLLEAPGVDLAPLPPAGPAPRTPDAGARR